MRREIHLNAFDMNCVGHIQQGLWTHPRDRTAEYNRLPYWLDLAKALERGLMAPLPRASWIFPAMSPNGRSSATVHSPRAVVRIARNSRPT